MIIYALISAGPRVWCINPSLKCMVINNPEGPSIFLCIRKTCLKAIIAIKVNLLLEKIGGGGGGERFEKFNF